MHVMACFESNVYVEMALQELSEIGIDDEHISMVEMEEQKFEQQQNYFDSIHHSDGTSLFDGMMAMATVGGLFGAIYGSQVKMGSIALGLIGCLGGALIGVLMDRIKGRKKLQSKKIPSQDILLIIRCFSNEQTEAVMSICRKFYVINLGKHNTVNRATGKNADH